MSYFSDNYFNVRYPIITKDSSGLKKGQLGAIHAIASHNSLNQNDSSIVVMPTGTGKTAVLMMAPYILQKTKVLIITPSAIVRRQITDDYASLSTLKKIGVFNSSVNSPCVYEAKCIFSDDQIEEIKKADVVISTHIVAASISKSILKNEFDYIIIDEAHHVPATTWQRILKNMSGTASLLLTATPFRLDNKEIAGTHIFNYPLSMAYKDGDYSSISFTPVSCKDDKEKDESLAKEAQIVFNDEKNEGYSPLLMIRTDTKEKAKTLEKIYQNVTDLKLKRIDSSMSTKTIDTTLTNLKNGGLNGIICVDMLGEGFNLPSLKIAVIHDPHKSLASTLQFIGRFTRTNEKNVSKAVFIAINDDSFKIQNKKLFASDSVWQEIIPDLYDSSVKSKIEKNDVLRRFSYKNKKQINFSIDDIKIKCFAKVYKVKSFDFDASFPSQINIGENVCECRESNTIIGMSTKNETVPWSKNETYFNTKICIYIVHFQKETNLLFIYSQNKSDTEFNSIASAFCGTDYEKIHRNEMNRVLAGFSDYVFFNTGMQNRFIEKGESYRIYAGANTTASIDCNTGQMLSAGHAFCRVQQNNEYLTIGYSSGSKIWSSMYCSVDQYILWCDLNGKKIANKELAVKTKTTYDNLPFPHKINEFKNIIFCFFSPKTYSSPPLLYIKDIKGNDTSLGLLTDSELILEKPLKETKKVYFNVVIGKTKKRFYCDVNGEYYSDEVSEQLFCGQGHNRMSLKDYFIQNPLQFKATDDAVYCGNEVVDGIENLVDFNTDIIDAFDWEKYNTDICSEIEGAANGKKTIHDTLQQYLKEQPDYSYIVKDHGPGEIADFIAIKTSNDHLNIDLFHCKAKKGKRYNYAITDVYEVSQQAVKSIIWLKTKAFFFEKLISRINSNQKELLLGNESDLKQLIKENKQFRATIHIVQPAISKKRNMSPSVKTVLSAAYSFITKIGVVKDFRIMGSE